MSNRPIYRLKNPYNAALAGFDEGDHVEILTTNRIGYHNLEVRKVGTVLPRGYCDWEHLEPIIPPRKEDTNMNHNHNHNQSQPMLTPREYAILLGWIYHNPNADQPRSFKIEVSNWYASTSKEIQTTVWVHDFQIGGKHFTPEELRKLTEPHEIDVAINSHELEREKKEYERLKAKFTEQNTEGGYNHATSEDKE